MENEKNMYQRFFVDTEDSYFLFGPRGTGKSTYLKQKYPNAYWIDLLNPEIFRLFSISFLYFRLRNMILWLIIL